jgi:hypothetical protein
MEKQKRSAKSLVSPRRLQRPRDSEGPGPKTAPILSSSRALVVSAFLVQPLGDRTRSQRHHNQARAQRLASHLRLADPKEASALHLLNQLLGSGDHHHSASNHHLVNQVSEQLLLQRQLSASLLLARVQLRHSASQGPASDKLQRLVSRGSANLLPQPRHRSAPQHQLLKHRSLLSARSRRNQHQGSARPHRRAPLAKFHNHNSNKRPAHSANRPAQTPSVNRLPVDLASPLHQIHLVSRHRRMAGSKHHQAQLWRLTCPRQASPHPQTTP